MKLDNKGYLIVEVIVATVLALVMAYFLIDITMEMKTKNDDAYNETIFLSDNKSIIVYLKDKDLYLDLEDYIVGVVAAEMPALFMEEALKAQAVAARSFATSNMKDGLIKLYSSVSDQLYKTNYELKEKWGEEYPVYINKIKDVVNLTKDIVIKRDDKILKTYYFSMSNGYTENSVTVFNENTFESVESIYEDEDLPNFKVTKEFNLNEVNKKLGVDKFIINDIVKNDTGHVEKIIVDNVTFKGTEFRKLLNLRSTDFEINNDGDILMVTTKGYGHGVGMSQYGANLMAKQGFNYEEIINHFYKNTYIDKI